MIQVMVQNTANSFVNTKIIDLTYTNTLVYGAKFCDVKKTP